VGTHPCACALQLAELLWVMIAQDGGRLLGITVQVVTVQGSRIVVRPE